MCYVSLGENLLNSCRKRSETRQSQMQTQLSTATRTSSTQWRGLVIQPLAQAAGKASSQLGLVQIRKVHQGNREPAQAYLHAGMQTHTYRDTLLGSTSRQLRGRTQFVRSDFFVAPQENCTTVLHQSSYTGGFDSGNYSGRKFILQTIHTKISRTQSKYQQRRHYKRPGEWPT